MATAEAVRFRNNLLGNTASNFVLTSENGKSLALGEQLQLTDSQKLKLICWQVQGESKTGNRFAYLYFIWDNLEID